MKPAYVYRCELLRVIDGDTLEARVDLGFLVFVRCKLRLLGVNCPELGTEAGRAARDYTAGVLTAEFVIQSVKVDKYGGRWDALVWVGERCLNDELVKAGHAVRTGRGGLSGGT